MWKIAMNSLRTHQGQRGDTGELCREGHRSQTQLLHQPTFASNLKQAKKGQFSVFMRKAEISVRLREWESIFPSAILHHRWRVILLMCWGFAFFKYHWYLFSLLTLNSNEAEVSSVPWWGIYPKKASRNVWFLGLQTSFHLSSIPSVCLAAPPPLPSSSLWSQPPRPVKWTFS